MTGAIPADGLNSVAVSSVVTASFSEPIDAATVNGSTFELRDAGNALIPATVSYDAASRTATLTPSAPLDLSTTYTARLKGGVTDPRIKDLAGNALAADVTWSFTTAVELGGCAAPANPIVAENCQLGNAPSEWDVVGSGDGSIQGFATDISVNRGETVSFKIDTDASDYRLDIYRMGYYGGLGARKVGSTAAEPTGLSQRSGHRTDRLRQLG